VWLVRRYSQAGLEFDEIWGWELTKHDPTQYWSAIPPRIKSVLHWCATYTVGAPLARD
jgi:hypothetical protein